MKTYKSIVLALLIGASFACHADSAFPEVNGVAYAPDGMLMPNGGPKWWYRSQPSITVTPHQTRRPTAAEQKVIARAQHMMEEYLIKAIALIDGDQVVYGESVRHG